MESIGILCQDRPRRRVLTRPPDENRSGKQQRHAHAEDYREPAGAGLTHPRTEQHQHPEADHRSKNAECQQDFVGV